MRFLLDENVPVLVADKLIELGHQAEFIRGYVPPGAPDPLVATVAEELDAVLISFDGDFKKIAPRIPEGHRTRFRRLSRIWMRCDEPDAADRIESCIALIESEYAVAMLRTDARMHMQIGRSFIRTDR